MVDAMIPVPRALLERLAARVQHVVDPLVVIHATGYTDLRAAARHVADCLTDYDIVPDLVPRLEVFFNGSDRDAHAVHGWLLAYNYTPTGVYQPDRLNALNWLIAHQAITITHSVDPAMYTIHLDRMARLRDEHSIPPAHPWMRREIDPHGHENDVEEVASRMYAAIYPNTPWPSTEPSTKDEWRNAAAAVLRDYLYSMFDWA